MIERQKFSNEFKQSLVVKSLNRGSESIREVCEREGVSHSTGDNWMRASGKVASRLAKPGGRMKWTAEAKLKAVIETTGLNETDLGKYLRQAGLYSTQVEQWRAEVLSHLAVKSEFKKDERDDKIRVLEREILRKDKALAEASALLILQKKVDLIWGRSGEDEK